MSHMIEQIILENFQKLDDVSKQRVLSQMQQYVVLHTPVDVATWQTHTSQLRARLAPVAQFMNVLDEVRNEVDRDDSN